MFQSYSTVFVFAGINSPKLALSILSILLVTRLWNHTETRCGPELKSSLMKGAQSG